MSPNILKFDIGTPEEIKGRAFFYLDTVGEARKKLLCSLDINGTSLKESLREEIQSGRLILPEVFEPIFMKDTPLNKELPWDELQELTQKDFRDLISLSNEEIEADTLSQISLEQAVSQYTTIYKENIYLRLLQEFVHELFHKRRTYEPQIIYAALFQLAAQIWKMSRARREQDNVDLEYFYKIISDFQKKIPYLNTKNVAEIIKSGTYQQWIEMADSVDVLYLTLKLYKPVSSETSLLFKVKADCLEWLKQEIPNLYQEYFVALFHEDYEKAVELKSAIDNRALCKI